MNEARILVRAPNWIGDQILAFPFFLGLRKLKPQAHIAVACTQAVADLQYLGLVDAVHILDQPASPGFGDRYHAVESSARKLKNQGAWDLAISLPNSISSAWLLFRSGAKRRLGYDGDARSFLLTDKISWKKHGESVHRAQAYLNLLGSLGFQNQNHFGISDIREFWGVPAENELDDDTPGVLKSFEFRKHWRAREMIEKPQGPYWVMAPGATADSRRWNERNWIALSEKIQREWGLQGVVVGGPKEVVLAEQICKQSKAKLFNRAGDGAVPDFCEVFSGAEFAVTNESGLAHVAALCGAPTQIVCGAADPRRTRPIGPGTLQVSINPISCWPCERNQCLFEDPARKNLCHEGQSSELIFDEIHRLRGKRRNA